MKANEPGVLSRSDVFSFIPSELARELFFYPTWCGHYYCNDSYFMKRDSYPHPLIVFIREGVLKVTYRGESFRAKKGDIVFLDCTEPHYYHAEKGLEFVYLHFNGSNSHELSQHILDRCGPLIRQESNLLVGHELFRMVEFYKEDGLETMIQSSSRIYGILELLLTPDHQYTDTENPIESSIRYIRSHLSEDLSLQLLADLANLSVFYFAHIFRDETGFAPMEYVTKARLEQIKVMLAKTTIPIAEIASKVGYSSPSSLNKMFVRHVGISPGHYRKAYQAKES